MKNGGSPAGEIGSGHTPSKAGHRADVEAPSARFVGYLVSAFEVNHSAVPPIESRDGTGSPFAALRTPLRHARASCRTPSRGRASVSRQPASEHLGSTNNTLRKRLSWPG